MDPSLTIVVFIAAAAAVIVGLLVIGLVWMSLKVHRARVVAPARQDRKQPLTGARAVVDQSIGMYLVRRLSGRPTSATSATSPMSPTSPTSPQARPAPSEPVGLTPEQVAYRLRIARAVPPDRRAFGLPPALAAASQPDARAPAPPSGPVAPRNRLARDTALALAGLLSIGLVAFAVWPGGSAGNQPTATEQDVAGASATPGPSGSTDPVATSVVGAVESPAGSVAAETFAPSPGATRVPTSVPQATPRPTPRSTPRGTAKPTPTPTLDSTPSPSSSPSPTPDTTPIPTPETTPTPGPTPTPSASGV